MTKSVVPQCSIVGPFRSSVILATLLIYGVTGVYAQDVTTNGNFETGPFDTNGTISGWSAGSLVTNTTEGTLPSHVAAFNVAGDSQGNTLSQTFTTSTGQWYQLVFDSQIYGSTASPLQLNVQISGGPTLLNRSITPPKPGTTWAPASYRFSFRANNSNTTLQFSDIGSGNTGTDTLLDNVSVAPIAAPAAGPLPLTNGNFETGPFSTNGVVTGWTAEGPADISIESTEGATNASGHAVVFNAGHDSQSNILSQTFSTTVGQAYNVDFDSGIFGAHSGGPLQFRVRVIDTSTASALVDQTVLPPEAGTFNGSAVTFTHYHVPFTATGASTMVEFSDIGTGANNADIVLDSVTVAIPTPTPVPTPTPTPTPSPTPAPTATPTTLPLNNPSFESPPELTIGTITGWTVGGAGQIASIQEGATDGTHSAAFSAGGDSAGNTLSQSFVTLPDRMYSLDFDAAVFGTATESTLHLAVQVSNTNPSFSQTVVPPYGPWTDAAQVQFEHYHFMFTATGTVSTIQFADIFLGNQFADVVLDKVSIVALPPSYTQWRDAHFTPAQQSDSNVSGWSADPDHDGFKNGLEYFSNTDPLQGVSSTDASAVPRSSIQSTGGSRYLTFSYRRLIGWSGDPEAVAVSDNLSNWDSSGNQLESAGNPVPTGDGVTEIVTVRFKTTLDQGLQRKFIRLQVSE